MINNLTKIPANLSSTKIFESEAKTAVFTEGRDPARGVSTYVNADVSRFR